MTARFCRSALRSPPFARASRLTRSPARPVTAPQVSSRFRLLLQLSDLTTTPMGRHRSTLRELGWGVSNSPNPWKQGSAKRVVRTLDYSQAEIEDPPPAAEPPTASNNPPPLDDKLNQLQQDGALLFSPRT